MRKRIAMLALIVFQPVAAGCATATGPTGVAGPVPADVRTVLALSIDSIIDAPPLHRASWGVLVADARTGAVLYSRNPERHFIPASNMKLVVGAVALGRLGPDYRYRTELRAASGTAPARLVVVGSGDPTWSLRFHDRLEAPFDSLAERVVRAGIRQADELVVDVSRFRDERVHPTWEVSDLPGVYAPPVDAFAAAEGTFRLVLRGAAVAGQAGEAVVAAPLPQPIRATVVTDTAGARPGVSTDYTARRDTIYLSARVGAGSTDTVTLAVTKPADAAAAAFADALRRRGVAVGAIRVVRDSAEAGRLRDGTGVIGAFDSPSMDSIVAAIMRPSQNWIAEQVAKTLGAHYLGDGSWRGGNAVQHEYLATTIGIDSLAVNLRDASGMSAQNLLTPAATVAILAHARAQHWGAAFRAGLPQPGATGTTLSARLAGLEGRVFAKTGTISNVNSLSGYFVAADGSEYLFSILSNGSGLPSTPVRAAIDDVVRAMARHLDGTGNVGQRSTAR